MKKSAMARWIARCIYAEAKRRGLREDLGWGRHNNILYGVKMEVDGALEKYFKRRDGK